VVLDNVNYNTIDVWKSLHEYDDHSIDFNENIFYSSYNSNKNVLFKGSTQIVDETVHNLINLYIKHRMTKFNLEDMLTVINNMLPHPNSMPKTLYKLFSYIKNICVCSFLHCY